MTSAGSINIIFFCSIFALVYKMADAIVSTVEIANKEDVTGDENVDETNTEAETVEHSDYNEVYALRHSEKMENLANDLDETTEGLDEAAEIRESLNQIIGINTVLAEQCAEIGADYEHKLNVMESTVTIMRAEYEKLVKSNEKNIVVIQKLTIENAKNKFLFRQARAQLEATSLLFNNAKNDSEDSGIAERENDDSIIEVGSDAEQSVAEMEEDENIQPVDAPNLDEANNENNQPIEPLAENSENRNGVECGNENDVMVIEDGDSQGSANTPVGNVKSIASASTTSNIAAVAASVLNNENAENENGEEASTSGVFRCTKCPETFDRRPLLNRHKAEVHGIKRKMKAQRRSSGKNHLYLLFTFYDFNLSISKLFSFIFEFFYF